MNRIPLKGPFRGFHVRHIVGGLTIRIGVGGLYTTMAPK